MCESMGAPNVLEAPDMFSIAYLSSYHELCTTTRVVSDRGLYIGSVIPVGLPTLIADRSSYRTLLACVRLSL